MAKVSDLMSQSVLTLSPDSTLYEAAQTLANLGVSGAPVVENEKLDLAKSLLEKAKGKKFLLPVDHLQADKPAAGAATAIATTAGTRGAARIRTRLSTRMRSLRARSPSSRSLSVSFSSRPAIVAR